MTTAATVTATALVVVGAYLLAIGGWAYRRHEGPGTTAFAAFVALFAAGGGGAGVLVLLGAPGALKFWLLQCTELGSVAWLVFAVWYTGRGDVLTRRRLAGLVGAYALVWPPAWNEAGASGTVIDLLGVLTNLYGVVLTLAGVTLLVQTTHRHGVISSRVGVILGAVAVLPWVFADWFALVGTTPSTPVWYAAGFVALAALLSVAVFRLDALSGTAATLPVGRRALRSGTEDLVVVVDGEGRVVEVNEAVRRRLGSDAGAASGGPVVDLLGVPVDDIAGTDVLTLDTVEGRRQFDVQCVPLSDEGDRPLGELVSLRDITRRRQREQGLDVLDRVLRHNLRNELSVIESRTTLVAEQLDDPELADHLAGVRRATRSLVDLSDKAASTRPVFETDDLALATVEVADVVEPVARSVESELPGSEVTVQAVDDATVTTYERLLYLAVENVVENAAEHAGTADPSVEVTVGDEPDGVRVTVDDEGAGIPAAERAVIEREEETELEHGSGLGLWLTNWAVTGCGGTVTFDDYPGGGRVELWIPDRNATQN
jgi:signal transduction histidine kinase